MTLTSEGDPDARRPATLTIGPLKIEARERETPDLFELYRACVALGPVS
jgi:hypothetical protein